jgi:hypothetical protein
MDVNVKAFRLVQGVTGEAPERKTLEKQGTSRKGGLKGGQSRALAMTPQRRSEIARKASDARWSRRNVA